jgi:hypothetical protein
MGQTERLLRISQLNASNLKALKIPPELHVDNKGAYGNPQ